MKHEPEIAIHADRNTLSDTAQLVYGAALRARQGRLRGPKEEWTVEPKAFERLTDDASFQRIYISSNIRQLWQLSEYRAWAVRIPPGGQLVDFALK